MTPDQMAAMNEVEEWEVDGLGLVEDDPNDETAMIDGLGRRYKKQQIAQSGRIRSRRRKKSRFSRTGLVPMQRKNADAIWYTIYSQAAVPVTTDSETRFFSGSPSNREDGNVSDGILPAPQSMIVKRIQFAALGIGAAGLTSTDYAALMAAVLLITVADKKFLEVPLSTVGINAIVIAGTDSGPIIPNGPPSFYPLPIPIVIPSNSKFGVSLFTGDKAVSGNIDCVVSMSGDMNRLVL